MAESLTLTPSFLQPTNFRMSINRLPTTQWLIQQVSIPGLTIGVSEQQTPFVPLKRPGLGVSWQELVVSFVVDEDMQSYSDIFEWMTAAAISDQFTAYQQLKDGDYGVVSDIAIVVTQSSSNPNLTFNFKDAFPVSLSDIPLDITATDIIAPICTATFAYNSFAISRN